MKIGVLGAGGRLGSEFVKLAPIAAAPKRGESLDGLAEMDVVLEVASPEAGVQLMEHLTRLKTFRPLVIGSTGWTKEQILRREAYSKHASIVVAANFSAAVTVLRDALSRVTPVMDRLGYKILIEETHHIHKKDAPSGTALALAESMGVNASHVAIQSHREGEAIGLHRITLSSAEDTLVFEHDAKSRTLFARGAWLACEWAASKAPRSGIYSMTDVLGL